MIFSPKYYRDEILNENFEYLSIITEDGVSLEGIVYEPTIPPSATLLYFTGRSQDSVGMIKKFSTAYSDIRIITFNYRSFGKSGGHVNEKNIFSDGERIAQLIQKNYGEFYLLGFSLGSVITSYIATKVSVKGLFLIGSFDSITLLAKQKYKIDLAFLWRYKFNNIKFVKEITTDTYLFASKNDTVTYIENTYNLKKNIKQLAYYEEFNDLSHKELLFNEKIIKKIHTVIKKSFNHI